MHKAIGLEPATVALAGATVMLLVTNQKIEDALAGIEWPTLFFFLGLFVMVGALEETGAIGEVAQGIGDLTGGDRTAELLGITWISALGSGVVDNIPFTATMIPVVEELHADNGGDDAYWWALCAGGVLRRQLHLDRRRRERGGGGHGQPRGQPISLPGVPQGRGPGHADLDGPRHRLHRRRYL